MDIHPKKSGVARRNRDILRGNRWWDLYSIRTPLPAFQWQDFLNRRLCIVGLVLISVFILVAESTFLWRLPRAFFNIKSPLALALPASSVDSFFQSLRSESFPPV